ncbi:hypothetical protein BH20CHL6_BH20CHL6_18180 [soil metagenome]
MAHEAIATCPVCQAELHVTRLHCGECGTTVEGDFSPGRFSRLTREQMTVLESFLRSRGNLREMERDLGISYPTVRGRVDALVRSLGLMPPDGEPAGTDHDPTGQGDAGGRRAILERLARQELSAEEAAAALRAIGGER